MKTTPSVGQVLMLQESADPKRAQTTLSALRIGFLEARDLEAPAFRGHLNSQPVTALSVRLNPNGAGWAPDYEAKVREAGFTGNTQLRAYPRFLVTLLDLGEHAFGEREETIALLPEWQAIVDAFDEGSPRDRQELERFNALGILHIAGFKTWDKDPERAVRRIQGIRSDLMRHARACSALGLTPQDLKALLATGTETEVPLLLDDGLRGRVRRVWNWLNEKRPELDLGTWPVRTRVRSLPREQWPMPAEELLALIQSNPNISSSTRKDFKWRLGEMLGILVAQGVDVVMLLRGLTAKDAARILFQGIPLGVLPPELEEAAPQEIARAIVASRELRDAILASQRALKGSFEGRKSAENPFIALVVASRYAEGMYPSARGLLVLVQHVFAHHLDVCGPHAIWVSVRIKEANRLTRENPSEYQAKKRAAFRNPRLWARLEATLWAVLYDLATTPDTARSAQWLVDFRDALFAYMLILHPFRVRHFVEMLLDDNFAAAAYGIAFATSKMGKPIDVELPTGDRIGRLRAWVDLYLSVVRPGLLRGATSRHFWVPDHSKPNAGTRMRDHGFNDILIKVSTTWLKDVLPEAMNPLNPHLARHIVASWQLVVEDSTTRAAQLLGDSVATVLRSYSDVLESGREALKKYYSDYVPDPEDDPDQTA